MGSRLPVQVHRPQLHCVPQPDAASYFVEQHDGVLGDARQRALLRKQGIAAAPLQQIARLVPGNELLKYSCCRTTHSWLQIRTRKAGRKSCTFAGALMIIWAL
jgi:hypothetical protein